MQVQLNRKIKKNDDVSQISYTVGLPMCTCGPVGVPIVQILLSTHVQYLNYY